MAKFKTMKGNFKPKNPTKYFGGDPSAITYRSSWEFTCMQTFDENPMILGWGSETCAIPYMNPFTRRQTVYIPDFVVVYEDRNGKKHAEMIEVKPAKEVPGMVNEGAKKLSPRDKAAQLLNMAKWEAANRFCKKRGMQFRVLTEYHIYSGMRGKK